MEVRNESDYRIDFGMVKDIVEYVLKNENVAGDVSVVFVKRDKIEELNRNFRKGDGPTDVLTFLYNDEDLLGEIIVCPEIVEKNAKDFGLSFEEELILTLVHSALHLCGYDHEFSQENADIMMEKQKQYFEELRNRYI